MNSPPTPPYRCSVAATLHLMNSQIRCGFCREKVYGVFYKLRDKERSKESAYVSLNLIFRTPLISVYRLAMDATQQGDDVAGWKFGACSGISSRHSIKGSSEPFASSARGFSGFCLSFIRSNSEQFVFQNKNFSPLMPINCLINCPINFWTFFAFRVQKQINGF